MRGIALALVIGALVVAAVRWGSWVAGGSDSYCYVHQAERWAEVIRGLAQGHVTGLQVPEPLALDAPWADAGRAFAPAGHVPSPTVAGAIVPICPAGLSIAMAPLVAVGGPRAAFFVLPLFAAMLVAATSVVGARFGARVGVLSSVLVAVSPIVLYQAIQPMSDVPAAALWMVAVAAVTGTSRRSSLVGGLATSAAIVMRPNLLPLGLAIGVFLLVRPERTWRERLRMAATYAICCAPGCVIVAITQHAFYGSPLASGYGSLSALFAMSHVAPNLGRYLGWLWSTHTAAVALALLAPWLLPGWLTALLSDDVSREPRALRACTSSSTTGRTSDFCCQRSRSCSSSWWRYSTPSFVVSGFRLSAGLRADGRRGSVRAVRARGAGATDVRAAAARGPLRTRRRLRWRSTAAEMRW